MNIVNAFGKEVCTLSARELAQKIARRELSAVEALEAHLARIERRNPELNAVVSLDIESARRQAEAADVALAREEVRGPPRRCECAFRELVSAVTSDRSDKDLAWHRLR